MTEPGDRLRGVLQVGFGAFGPMHLEAWLRLGLGDRLWLADPDPAARARAAAYNLPAERRIADFRTVLERVEVVDVLTSTPEHFPACAAALEAGRGVFCEQPLTLLAGGGRVSGGARGNNRAHSPGRLLFSPSPTVSPRPGTDRHGRPRRPPLPLRHLRGFKRARADIGVTASDPVHFLDDFNWLTGGLPEQLFAIRRDHLGRGLDDLALILLEHPGGVVGKVEAGLIQPGRHVDLIAPGTLTSKEVALCGARGAIEIDFPAERLVWHRVRHQLQDGLFRPVFEDARIKHLPAATAVDCWRASSGSSSATSPDIARLLEAIGRSAQTGHRVACARPDG